MWPVEYRALAFRGTQDALRARTDTDDPPATPIGLVTELYPHITELGDMNCEEHVHWCATHKDACDEADLTRMRNKCQIEEAEQDRQLEEFYRMTREEEDRVDLDFPIRLDFPIGAMKALCRKIQRGELEDRTKLEFEIFRENNISDSGMKLLSKAIEPTLQNRNPLAKLQLLNLLGNNIGDAGMKSFSRAITRGALANLRMLRLAANQIGNEGMTAFTKAIGSGALPKLEWLVLDNWNLIDADVIAEFADQITHNALPSLETLIIENTERGDDVSQHQDSYLRLPHPHTIQVACKARRIELLPSIGV